MPFFARAVSCPLAVLAFVLVPKVAGASPAHHKASPTARMHKPERKASASPPLSARGENDATRGATTGTSENGRSRACFSEPVEVVAGSESAVFSLTKCDGSATPLAVDQLSVLARPSTSSKPKQPLEILAKAAGAELAPGVRRLDVRLVERLARVTEHFRAQADTPKVVLDSGKPPRAARRFHLKGRAVDFRLDGVTDDALLAFCKTLQDTGCGYYPASHFIHMDVREAGTGHVSWIDVSRPGGSPRYVAQWPAAEASRPSKLPVLPASAPPVSVVVPVEREITNGSSPHFF